MSDAGSDPQPFELGTGEGRQHAPATLRNRDAIAGVLADWLPANGEVLEIASGTGEHAVHFARAFPRIAWQPSDYDPAALASISAWPADAGLPNLRSPIRLDLLDAETAAGMFDAIFCANLTHIAPWAATEGLFALAGRCLAPGGKLIVYGPFIEEGVATAPSNLAFDRSLRQRNEAWGLRDLGRINALAEVSGLQRAARIPMPANNLTVIWRAT